MKKWKVIVLVTNLLVSMFMFLISSFSVAHATYVEGIITQDTIWTLIDSPFIVVNNVTVLPGVTLIIEPGVEVRFGGNFSLNIMGRLMAQGIEDRTIRFISNRPAENAEPGDWNAINFIQSNGSQLSYCIIKYATNGIIIENSSLEISNCEIVENFKNGIKILGNCNLTIKNSKIMLNENGVTPIFLNIDSSQQVTLDNNIISSNQYGIYINGEIENFNVVDCDLMSNDVGIYISGKTELKIMHNSIAYNEIGVFCENSSSAFSINYNDLYSNTLAIRSVNSEPINATYNYWGDKTGPYHPSLNPYGKGNPVESNGIDVDFIPFLLYPNRYENKPPTAWLITDKTTVAPNQEVLFVATNSSDDGQVNYYLLDFGDGEISGWTTLSIFTHKYSTNGTYTAKLVVLDDFGARNTNPAQITINVRTLPTLDAFLSVSAYAAGCHENISVTVQVKSGTAPIENASVKLLSINGGYFNPNSGYTNATGYFTTTFTTPDVTNLRNVMLIVTASKEGYVDGSDYKYVQVMPPLTVEIQTYPSIVKSEEKVNTVVYVTYAEQPIQGATVSISADLGNISPQTATTDLEGKCEFIFTAPAVSEKKNVTITATASKEGYEEGNVNLIVTVEPKTLTLEVHVYPKVVISERTANISVHATYNAQPVSDVNITIAVSYGSFSASALTNLSGICTFTFVAPPVNEEVNVTITAYASKTGYAATSSSATITLTPGILELEVNAPAEVLSGTNITISVGVTCNLTPVQNALVTVTSYVGNFSQLTNSDGICIFNIIIPETNEKTTISITIAASKNGYREEQKTIYLDVLPVTGSSQGGLPLTLILMIMAIILAIIVVIALLIRFKVIEIHLGEKEA